MKRRLALISLITFTMSLPLWAFDEMKISEVHRFMKIESDQEMSAERKPSSSEEVEPSKVEIEKKMFKEHFYGRPELDR